MKIAVILNSRLTGGRKREIELAIRCAFHGAILAWSTTRWRRHAVSLARDAARSGADIVIAAGGDGTINEVLNGILGSRAMLGIIPAGTANDLAAYHGIRTDIGTAVDILRRGFSDHVDVIRVNGWHYLTAGGIGLPAAAAHAANTLKRHRLGGILARGLLRSALYPLAVTTTFFRERDLHCPIIVRSAAGSLTADAFTLMVSNQPFLGGHFHVSPGADGGDGWIDVCLIRNGRTRLTTLKVVAATMRGRHVSSQLVTSWRTKDLHIRTERPVWYFGDGEILDASTDFDISVVHGALSMIVPGASRPGTRREGIRATAESLDVAA